LQPNQTKATKLERLIEIERNVKSAYWTGEGHYTRPEQRILDDIEFLTTWLRELRFEIWTALNHE